MEDEGLKITFLPAQHWSKRSVRDGGQRLWGAFLLQKLSEDRAKARQTSRMYHNAWEW